MSFQRKIIVVTPTYNRPNRKKYLQRVMRTLRRVPNILWLLVEDDSKKDPDIELLLNKSMIEHLYLNIGPTRDLASTQRSFVFEYIKKHKLQGIIYVADDDNYYSLRLFKEIRKTKRISVFPVGHLSSDGIERPMIKNKRIIGWNSDWQSRKFPVDWAAIAFDAKVLNGINPPIIKGVNWFEAVNKGLVDPSWDKAKRVDWLRENKEGESEFLEKFMHSWDEFELLNKQCTRCYAWHNQPLEEHPWYTYFKRNKHRFSWQNGSKIKNILKRARFFYRLILIALKK